MSLTNQALTCANLVNMAAKTTAVILERMTAVFALCKADAMLKHYFTPGLDAFGAGVHVDHSRRKWPRQRPAL
jgi:hypothetical protein